MIQDNVTLLGKADTPEFSKALLQYRNTKDRDTGISPAATEFPSSIEAKDTWPEMDRSWEAKREGTSGQGLSVERA